MDSFERFRKSGTFIVAAGTEVQGDLTLDGAKTTLDLYARDFFSTDDVKEGCILGELHDRTKVSLIDCITTQGPGSGWRGNESDHFSTVFPHVVIFGKEHITATDRKIQRVSFHVDDAATLFYDFEAFGQVIGDRSHMTKIIETKRASGRDIEVGDDPMLFYFTGNFEIFKAETVLGTVSAEHRPSFAMPGPSGIKVDNKIQVCLSFKDVVTVDEALNAVHTLLRFLEIIAGHTQTVLSLSLLISGPEGDVPNDLRVYWSMAPSHTSDERGHKIHPMDLPIQAARAPEYFANVLTSWLARDHEWRSARSRFSTAFSPHRSFNIDRLVSAANMFDILPALRSASECAIDT